MPPDGLTRCPRRAGRGSADDTPVPGAAFAVQGKTAGTQAPFIEFYDREYHLLVRFMMNCGASLTAAEDAAQEAFLDAWKLMSVPGKWAVIDDPRGWILAAALRKYWRPPGVRKAPQTILQPVMPDTGIPG